MEAILPKSKEYTIDDILSLPEGERAELIDGQWFAMASLETFHQEIVMAVSRELSIYVRKKGGNCKVLPAPFAVFLSQDNRNYLEPDITVVCDPAKLDKRGLHGAPDLVVEVTSPSTRTRDYLTKLWKYMKSGVSEYWIIDTDSKVITTYVFDGDDEEQSIVNQYNFTEPLQAHLYPDFTMTLSDIL